MNLLLTKSRVRMRKIGHWNRKKKMNLDTELSMSHVSQWNIKMVLGNMVLVLIKELENGI